LACLYPLARRNRPQSKRPFVGLEAVVNGGPPPPALRVGVTESSLADA
jgi:hypothetical protein